MPRSVLLRMRNISDKSDGERKNYVFLFNNFSVRKSCHLWDSEEKYIKAGRATDDNMANAHCMLDTQGYKHKLSICNTNCFYMISILVWTRLTVTLYVFCLACHSLVQLWHKIYSSHFNRNAKLHCQWKSLRCSCMCPIYLPLLMKTLW
jgi:hypothetical protein